MTDSLRTRIAAVIESIRIQRDGDAARMADAVIREALTPEFLADMMIAAVKKAADDERRIKAEQAAAFHSRGSNLLHTKDDNEQT